MSMIQPNTEKIVAANWMDAAQCFAEMLDLRIRMQVQPSRKVREAIVKIATQCFVDESRHASISYLNSERNQ